MRKLGSALIAVAALMLCLGLAGVAKATPLNLLLLPEPDIYYNFASTDYNATSDLLQVDGFAQNIDALGSPDVLIVGGLFDLDATVDSTGSLLGGSFTVSGTVASLGFNSGTLLTGTLTQIGFPDGTQGALEFLFTVGGGDAAGLYGGTGATTGALTVTPINGFPGGWTSDFSASFNGAGDVATVPEPSSLPLIGAGLAILARSRRARRT